MLELYVYDKELNDITKVSGYPEDSIIAQVLRLKLSNIDLSKDPDFEEAVQAKDRFIFFNKSDMDSIIKTAFTIRNPIIDNMTMQRYYGFDKTPMGYEQLRFRLESLLTEEFNETMDAFKNKNAEELVDGLIDLTVIAYGILDLFGVDVNKAWSAVFKANMAKEVGIKPGREDSGGIDLKKPEGWVAPSHEDNHGALDELFSQTKS